MKSRSEILSRARELVAQELKARLYEATSRKPHLCHFNHVHALTPSQTNGSDHIRLCMYGAESPEEWPGNICDDDDTARQCPYFTPNTTPEEATEQLKEDLQNAEWLSENMPELATLCWVLDRELPPRFSWWTRLRSLIWKAHREPQAPAKDLLLEGLLKGNETIDS